MALSTPDYGMHPRMAAQSAATLHSRQQRPYSVAVPGFSQVGGLEKSHKNTHKNTHTGFFPHMISQVTHELSRQTKPGKDLCSSVSESLDVAPLHMLLT